MNPIPAFPPMKWLFSDSDSNNIASTSKSKLISFDSYEEPDKEIVSYGPQLKRKGNIKFVKAKVVESNEIGKGKGSEIPVRGLYEDTDLELSQNPMSTSKSSSSARIKKLEIKKVVTQVDVDLTIDDSDDDIIICDATTRQPLPPPTIRCFKKSKTISQLLSKFNATTPADLPPTHYGLNENNIGWKMLQKSGWKEGQGLGILEKSIKVPIKAILKTDRVGLGMIAAQGERRKRNDGPILAKKKGKRERRREREIAEEAEAARGKGRTGMARDYHRDERERKAMLNYMNQ